MEGDHLIRPSVEDERGRERPRCAFFESQRHNSRISGPTVPVFPFAVRPCKQLCAAAFLPRTTVGACSDLSPLPEQRTATLKGGQAEHFSVTEFTFDCSRAVGVSIVITMPTRVTLANSAT